MFAWRQMGGGGVVGGVPASPFASISALLLARRAPLPPFPRPLRPPHPLPDKAVVGGPGQVGANMREVQGHPSRPLLSQVTTNTPDLHTHSHSAPRDLLLVAIAISAPPPPPSGHRDSFAAEEILLGLFVCHASRSRPEEQPSSSHFLSPFVMRLSSLSQSLLLRMKGDKNISRRPYGLIIRRSKREVIEVIVHSVASSCAMQRNRRARH